MQLSIVLVYATAKSEAKLGRECGMHRSDGGIEGVEVLRKGLGVCRLPGASVKASATPCSEGNIEALLIGHPISS